ncbi:MAG: hypothetical protein ACR5LF_15775 [Symbiopectobacterium sp.]
MTIGPQVIILQRIVECHQLRAVLLAVILAPQDRLRNRWRTSLAVASGGTGG